MAATEKTVMTVTSAEEVAYDLFKHIINVEKRSLHAEPGNGYTRADREYILKTYGECISTVRQGWYGT